MTERQSGKELKNYGQRHLVKIDHLPVANPHAAVAYQQVDRSPVSWSCDAVIPLVAHGGAAISQHVALESIQHHCPQRPVGCWDVKRVWQVILNPILSPLLI
jgi:hypothetical protein